MRCMMHGAVEFWNVTPKLARNNDERAAAEVAIVSPQRHYRESISWVAASVQRGLILKCRVMHLVLF